MDSLTVLEFVDSTVVAFGHRKDFFAQESEKGEAGTDQEDDKGACQILECQRRRFGFRVVSVFDVGHTFTGHGAEPGIPVVNYSRLLEIQQPKIAKTKIILVDDGNWNFITLC
jgi:hypothetical protein